MGTGNSAVKVFRTDTGRPTGLARTRFAEHALKDGVDVLEVIAEVELLGYLAIAEIFFHVGVFFSSVRKSPSPRHTGIALRCTNL